MILKKALIIGGNSFIGRHVAQKLILSNFTVDLTSKRTSDRNNFMFFDLAQPNYIFLENNYNVAIICAGMSGLSQCQQNQSAAWRINFENTIELTRNLMSKNIFTILLSTSSVFEGYGHNCRVDEKHYPISSYGETKAKLEQETIRRYGSNVAILRLTKVVGKDWQQTKRWNDEYKKNGIIKAFSNRFFYPISLELVSKIICHLADNPVPGVFQIGGDSKFSFYEFAKKIYGLKGFDGGKIIPIEDEDEDRKKWQAPNLRRYLPSNIEKYVMNNSDINFQKLL